MSKVKAGLVLATVLGAFVGLDRAAAEDQVTAQTIPHGDVIFARRVLMGGVDVYMQEIEAFAEEAEAQGTPVPFEAAEAADIVSTMMIALPHLFPEGSDFWSEAAEAEDPTSVTLALPKVWDDFDTFYREANAVAQAAFDLSRKQPRDGDWIAEARALRASCEACHAAYTRFRTIEDPEPPQPIRD